MRVTADNGAVTCRVCLYHLGLYVPLVKLRDHQAQQIKAAWDRAFPC